jgi:hypothetical protein
MKKLLLFTLSIGCVFTMFSAAAQDMAKPKGKAKGPRPSPADTVKQVTKKGVAIEVDYCQPGVKGRTVGKEIAPFDGKPWRTGANEETTISFSKDVKLEGKELPAGKYSLWTIPGEKEWVIIINKRTTDWGTDYKPDNDVFRVTVETEKAPAFTERLKCLGRL